jgi:D-alanyl-D-alanine dipeptidase
MGTPIDFFSTRSWPTANVGAEAKANRGVLASAMRRHGFRSYDKEWWHFTLSHEPFPDTYFDFPVR